jgi:orotidine-5'-phosphate decarboxylase
MNKKIIIALDYADQNAAIDFVSKLDVDSCRLKVGKEMFTRFGPNFVTKLQQLGFEIFLDLKFYDIPNTVAKAVQAAADLGVWMVNVHASGGSEMMKAAKDILLPYGDKAPLLIAVTVLTSMSEDDLKSVNVQLPMKQQVSSLAQLAKNSGLDGVVCSAKETTMLRQQLGKDFKLITPGIRPTGVSADDQKRIVTPSNAIKMGSDYLVIGRPITKAENPQLALQLINQEIEQLINDC